MDAGREKWLVRGVLHGGDPGIGALFLRTALTPLAALHRAGLAAYLLPFRLGLRKRTRLPVPVISVGNLSSGGTGKTPATALIAGYLQSVGKRVVVLSRGHGGRGEQGSEPRIVSNVETVLLSPADAGDEPVLLANLLPGVPVIVCRDRRKSGRLAVQTFAPDVLLCDDGLQYWQLHRDLDIVLLDARAPFDNGYVLPRGLLREPPRHLNRAGVVILTRADRVDADTLRRTVAYISTLTAPGVPVLTATHTPMGWVRPDNPANLLPVSAFAGKNAVVFSGIADDQAFADTVRGLGVRVQNVVSFGDHHAYTADDLQRIAALSAETGYAIATEKDLVKVTTLPGADAVPLAALRIALKVDNADALFERVLGVL